MTDSVHAAHSDHSHAHCDGCAHDDPVYSAAVPAGAHRVATPSPGGLGERTAILIEKMDCPTEEALIRKRLGPADGVAGMSFNLMQRRLTVDHAPGRLPDVLRALDEIGLGGTVEPSGSAPATSSAGQRPAAGHWKLALGGLTAIAAEAFALALNDHHPGVIGLALLTIGLTGLSTYKKGWFALRQLNLNINALMSVAVTGAVLIGKWPEAAMVMFLFALAETIEAMSLARARRAIEGLVTMAPDTATMRLNGAWQAVPVADVPLGSLLRARPGERIAMDGELSAGASAVDQSPITGESVPVDKAVGDTVFAGSINQDREFDYRVTAGANDSTLARIIHAVQEAQASRAPTQRFVDTFSAYYTPAVFSMAIAIAILPPLLGGADGLTWFYRALVMLVIACPCALVISTPVTVVSGLTAAARRGILVKGGLFLEQGHKLSVLALDKTGTLTRGRPALTDVIPLQGTRPIASRLAAFPATG